MDLIALADIIKKKYVGATSDLVLNVKVIGKPHLRLVWFARKSVRVEFTEITKASIP